LNGVDRSGRVLVGAFIMLVHVAALSALAWVRPASRVMGPDSPLSVQFIDQPQPRSDWQPPPVPILPVQVRQLDTPVLLEAATPPSERAITLPAPDPTPPAKMDDRSAPKLVTAVEYLQQPAPRYPPQSRRLREQGLVVLRVVIDEAGNACSIDIETSSGHPRLDAAAREAIERATFRPYMEDGAPRRALVLIPIEFALNRSTA
jgi:periplasmic protein TonB